MKKLPRLGDWVYSIFHESEGVVIGFKDVPDQWNCTCTVLLVGRDTPNRARVSALRVIRRADV